MDSIEAIVLGLLQGLTEFIPVSSSGHLVVGQHLFDGSSSHLFLGWINVGTLLALLLFFRSRISSILRDIFVQKDIRLARNILITALPAGSVGFFASDFIIETSFFGSVTTVLYALVIVGIVMVLLDHFPKKSAVQDGSELTVWRALVVGMLQIFALIPGVSRSGSTIIAGRLMGLSAAAAAEYSFLASLPIMSGVTLKLFLGSEERQYLLDNLQPLLIGNLVAFISGLLAVGFLMKFLANHSLAVFGWYRIGLAAVVAVILLLQ